MRKLFTPTISVFLVAIAGLFLSSGVVFAADSRPASVKIYDGVTKKVQKQFYAFSKEANLGASVAVADVDGDGKNDIIIGSGPNTFPVVRVFTAAGVQTLEFRPYDNGMKSGVKVAACDLNNDGKAEIVTGTGEKNTSQIRTFDSKGKAIFTTGFYAFGKTQKGGVNVACGDVTGDGTADIVAGSGVGMDSQVKVFDRFGKSLNFDITPYAARDKGGVAVAVGNVDGGKASEIITGIYRFGRSRIKVYRANAARTVLAEFEGWPESVQGGFNVASADLDGNGRDDIIVGIAVSDAPQFRVFSGTGAPITTATTAYEKAFTGGITVAAGDLDGDKKAEFVTVPWENTISGNTAFSKYIEVRLNEQRLYAYEKGKLVKTFLVSTGVKKYPTPPGTYTVRKKIEKKRYEWSYGENNPDNFDIPDVPWNLQFADHFYLHDAFWHNNFGHVMSHGCININLANSEWVFHWADVGTPVIVKGPQPFST